MKPHSTVLEMVLDHIYNRLNKAPEAHTSRTEAEGLRDLKDMIMKALWDHQFQNDDDDKS